MCRRRGRAAVSTSCKISHGYAFYSLVRLHFARHEAFTAPALALGVDTDGAYALWVKTGYEHHILRFGTQLMRAPLCILVQLGPEGLFSRTMTNQMIVMNIAPFTVAEVSAFHTLVAV